MTTAAALIYSVLARSANTRAIAFRFEGVVALGDVAWARDTAGGLLFDTPSKTRGKRNELMKRAALSEAFVAPEARDIFDALRDANVRLYVVSTRGTRHTIVALLELLGLDDVFSWVFAPTPANPSPTVRDLLGEVAADFCAPGECAVRSSEIMLVDTDIGAVTTATAHSFPFPRFVTQPVMSGDYAAFYVTPLERGLHIDSLQRIAAYVAAQN